MPFPTIKSLTTFLRDAVYKHTRMQDPKSHARYDYTRGPMYFLGQQICKRMKQAGYPASIVEFYRSSDDQAQLYAKSLHHLGPSNLDDAPWRSPYNFCEAVSISHPGVSLILDRDYWDALAASVRVVADLYSVQFELTERCDTRFYAQISLSDWREARERHNDWMASPLGICDCPPTIDQLWVRFEQVLPAVARDYLRRHDGRPPSGVSRAVVGRGLK